MMESNKNKIQSLKKKLKEDSLSEIFWVGLAEAYFCELRFKKAIKSIKKALSLNGRSKENWFILGMSHYYAHELDEAIRAFKKVIEIDPELLSAETYIDYIIFRKTEEIEKLQKFSIPDLNFLTLFVKNDTNIRNTLNLHYKTEKNSISNKQGLELKKKFKNPVHFFHDFLNFNII